MTRKLIVAAELTKLIQDEISTSKALDGDCRDCKASAVYWHEPDESGSNWDLHSFSGSSACTDFILSIVAKFKPIPESVIVFLQPQYQSGLRPNSLAPGG